MTRRADPTITDLFDDEGQLLIALRADRGRACNAACDLAVELGLREPRVDDYHIGAIKRLARRLSCEAGHWME